MTLWYNETHTWETRGGHTPSERIFGGSWPRPSVSDPTRVCVFHTFSTGSRSRGWEWRLRRRRGIRRTQVHRKSGGVQHCVTCLDLWLFARDTHKHTNAHAHTQTLHTHTHTHTIAKFSRFVAKISFNYSITQSAKSAPRCPLKRCGTCLET